jgi:hypothetical protein
MQTYHLLILLIPALLVFYLSNRMKGQRGREILQKPSAAEPAEGDVRCFTCGIHVPIENALEKNGRYFCGVRKQDREA